jgi:transcriptional regulator with XRE-family HTH domain
MVCSPSLCYRRFVMASAQPVGGLLRERRQRRRLSQLDLSCDAEISTRHLSFLETGRSQPSREMVLHLAAQLDVPLRERNVLLVAAGYAPIFPERQLADPALENARKAVDLVLTGHEPYPALAIDRHWMLIASNRAVAPLLVGADAALLRPPVLTIADPIPRLHLERTRFRKHYLPGYRLAFRHRLLRTCDKIFCRRRKS